MNVFLDKDDRVRIGDLGVAKVLQENNDFARTMIGTPFYLSPEMCEEKPYNDKSDMRFFISLSQQLQQIIYIFSQQFLHIWALGCVLYELCTSKHPFEAKTQAALVLKIIRGKYTPIPSSYSRELSDLVDNCLRRDYRSRPSASNILQKQTVIDKANVYQISLKPSVDNRQSDYTKPQGQKQSSNPSKQNSNPSSNDLQKENLNNNPLLKQNISKQPEQSKIQKIQNQIASNKVIQNQKQKNDEILNKKQSETPKNNKQPKPLNKPASQQNLNDKIQPNQGQKQNPQKPRPIDIEKEKQNAQKLIKQIEIDGKQKELEKQKEIEKEKEKEAPIIQKKQIKSSGFDLQKPIYGFEGKPQQPAAKQKSDPKVNQSVEIAKQPLKPEYNQVNSSVQLPQISQKSSQKVDQTPSSKKGDLKQKPKSTNNIFSDQKLPQQNQNLPKDPKRTPSSIYNKELQQNPVIKPKETRYQSPSQQRQPIIQNIKQNIQQENHNKERVRKGAPTGLARQAQNPKTKQLFGKDESEIDKQMKELKKQKEDYKKNLERYGQNSVEAEMVRDLPNNSDSSDNEVQFQKDVKLEQIDQNLQPELLDGDESDIVDQDREEESDEDKQDEQDIEKQEKNFKFQQQKVDQQFIDDEFNSDASQSKETEDQTEQEQEVKQDMKQLKNKFYSQKPQIEFQEPIDIKQRIQNEQDEQAKELIPVSEYYEVQQSNEDEAVIESNSDTPYIEEEENKSECLIDEDEQKSDNEYYDEERNSLEEDIPEQPEEEDEGDNENNQDQENEDSAEEFKQEPVQLADNLQKRLDDGIKREKELKNLLDLKHLECVRQLNVDKFNEILGFFRKKLNSDSELSADDQDEIDDMIQKHMVNHHNPQIIYTIYKILHLEIELEKTREKIQNLVIKIDKIKLENSMNTDKVQ